jgi:hypothetical protein
MNLSNHLMNWQRPLKLALLTAVGFAMAGCTISVFPGTGGGTTGTTISSLNFSSDIRDNSGQSLICDNATTNLTYTFNYSGTLDSWTSSLVGKNTGQQKGTTTLSLSDPRVGGSGSFVTVTYAVPPKTAPLSAPPLKPQSIIVSPAILGYTDLLITFYDISGKSGTVRLNRDIPVVSNC